MLKDAIARMDAAQQERRFDREFFLAQQRLLDELSPILCKYAREALRKQCGEYLRHLRFEVWPRPVTSILRLDQRACLSVDFKPAARRVLYSWGEAQEMLKIGIDQNGEAVFIDAKQRHFDPESVADRILEQFLS